MFYIVESEQQLTYLERLCSKGAYLEVISSNDKYHPVLASTIATYIHPVDHPSGYIIPIDHSEGLNVSKARVYDLLKQCQTLYVFDRKELLYHFNIQAAIDISLLYSMTYYERLEKPDKSNLTNWMYNRHREKSDLNRIIPLSKLHERSESNYQALSKYLTLEIPQGFDFYNKTATNVFFLLELSGVRVTYDAFIELFKPREPRHSIHNNIVYTSYNLYNTTSRPTSAFNSVNFAAIPKTELHRQCFIPQNDVFVEFDFDGYHLRLLAEQIGYELTEESAHKQLAKLYFEKDEITDEEYSEAKQINFHAIYGKIPEKYAFLEIFEKIQTYIDEMWKTYNKDGVVYNPISGKPFTKELKDMNPAKLMNYMMQSLETARNITILKEVLAYLRDKKTRIALYTYDAVLFDFSKEDGKETLEDLEKLLNPNKKYPVKFKYSQNLVL